MINKQYDKEGRKIEWIIKRLTVRRMGNKRKKRPWQVELYNANDFSLANSYVREIYGNHELIQPFLAKYYHYFLTSNVYTDQSNEIMIIYRIQTEGMYGNEKKLNNTFNDSFFFGGTFSLISFLIVQNYR